MNKREAIRPPLVLEDGDLLWKCWVSNVHQGVHVQVLSAFRADGTYSAAVVFIRQGKEGKPLARFWVKHQETEEGVLKLANDLTQAVTDDRLHFRLIDLSDLKGLDAQMARLHDEGFAIVTISRPGHRPEEN